MNGLNFSLPPWCLDYVDCLVDFELFCRNIRNLGILSNKDLDFVKIKTKEETLAYQSFNNSVLYNFPEEEFLLYKIYLTIKI